MNNTELAGMISGMEKVAVSDERVKQVADRRFKNTLHALDTGEGFSHAAAKAERNSALGMRRLGIKEKLEPFAKLKKDYDDVGNRAHGTTMKAPMSIGAKAGLIGAGVVGAGLLARHIYKKRQARKEQQKMAAPTRMPAWSSKNYADGGGQLSRMLDRHRAIGVTKKDMKMPEGPTTKMSRPPSQMATDTTATMKRPPSKIDAPTVFQFKRPPSQAPSTGMSIGAKAGIGAGVVGAGLLARHIYKKRKARKEQQKMAASRDLNDRDLLATHQAIGAGIGLVYHAHDRYDRSTQKPGESDKRFRYRRIRNTIAGGASGSVVGAGLGTITGTAHRRARQK